MYSIFTNCTINLAHWQAVSHSQSFQKTQELQRLCRCTKYGKKKFYLHLGYQTQQSVFWVSASVLNSCHLAQKQNACKLSVPSICKEEYYINSFFSLPNVILPPCISINCQFLYKTINLCKTHNGVLFSIVLDFCLKFANIYCISLQIILLLNVSQHRLCFLKAHLKVLLNNFLKACSTSYKLLKKYQLNQ